MYQRRAPYGDFDAGGHTFILQDRPLVVAKVPIEAADWRELADFTFTGNFRIVGEPVLDLPVRLLLVEVKNERELEIRDDLPEGTTLRDALAALDPSFNF